MNFVVTIQHETPVPAKLSQCNNDIEAYLWILQNREHAEVWLVNNCTWVVDNRRNGDDAEAYTFNDYMGNGVGIDVFLGVLGIGVESV